MTDRPLLPKALREERHFRWRGGEVSRIEALSDAVFAFSLTLLVVSLEVPRSSVDLVRVFWQFPAFAVCFAFLLWVWYEHFLFHRRFGFEDAGTVALTGVLLFFVVFYVYPLKFLSSVLITGALNPDAGTRFDLHGQAVMLLYSGGFVGIFAVLALLYWRAWRLREELGLDAAERVATRVSLRRQLLSVAIGSLSLVLAVAVPQVPALSGLVFFLMGPVQAWNGFRAGRELDRVVRDATER